MPESAVRRLIEMFEAISSVIEAERDHLSELDGAIGDADHGITMAIGFSAVTGELARTDAGSAGLSGVLTAAASSFLNAVGASTGPLYATAFRRAAQALKERDTLDLEACSLLIQAVASGIGERGKGQRGDKTMLDVWLPAATQRRRRSQPANPPPHSGRM